MMLIFWKPMDIVCWHFSDSVAVVGISYRWAGDESAGAMFAPAAQAQNNETELWIRMKYCVHQQDAKKHTKHWQILDIINWRVDDVRCLNVPTMAQQQYEPLTLGFRRVSPGFAFAHLRTGEAISGNINHEHQLWMFFFAWFLANFSNTPVLIFRNTTVMNFWQDDFWTDLHRPNKSWD